MISLISLALAIGLAAFLAFKQHAPWYLALLAGLVSYFAFPILFGLVWGTFEKRDSNRVASALVSARQEYGDQVSREVVDAILAGRAPPPKAPRSDVALGPVRPEDLRKCTFQRSMNLDYAGGGFAVYEQCVEYPRLTRITRVVSRGAPTEHLFEVDGNEFEIDRWDKVAAALNVEA
jgi:hypothetical protein